MKTKADHLLHAFDQGPFSAIEIAPFPGQLIELVQRATGRPFDPELFAAYERARAFLAFEGVVLTDDLRARQALSDPMADRGVQDLRSKRPRWLPVKMDSVAASSGGSARRNGVADPSDLGDD